MRDPETWAKVRLAELCGANFDELLEEAGELNASVEEELEKAKAMEKRLGDMPDIRTEGKAPSLEELEAAIAQADFEEEEEQERQAALERRKALEELEEKKRKDRRKFFAPTEDIKQEKSDDYGMEL